MAGLQLRYTIQPLMSVTQCRKGTEHHSPKHRRRGRCRNRGSPGSDAKGSSIASTAAAAGSNRQVKEATSRPIRCRRCSITASTLYCRRSRLGRAGWPRHGSLRRRLAAAEKFKHFGSLRNNEVLVLSRRGASAINSSCMELKLATSSRVLRLSEDRCSTRLAYTLTR